MSAIRTLGHYRAWLTPVVLIVGLAALLPAIYLSATVDPQGHLDGLPVALVVEEQSNADAPSAADLPVPDLAASVADAVEAGVGDKVALTRMTAEQMSTRIEDDRLAGAVVIPGDFDRAVASLLPGAREVTVPTVQIVTNAGDGGLANGLLVANLTPVLHGVAQGLGERLSAQLDPGDLSPAGAALLAEPFRVVSAPHEQLPASSGMGTSAFYYSLVLVLIGFIGASLVGPLVDSAVGFLPSEVGPLVQRRPYLHVSRPGTLLTKLAILTAAAPLAALVAQLVATGPVGVPVADPVMLWLFSTAVVAAIGTSALTVFAIFGSGIGSLVNTVFFIALSMTSSGGTVPLEAVPPFFRWISVVEPFRPVVDGIRSLFYFQGSADAGLADAWVSVGVGGSAGIVLGLAVTYLYGKVPAFDRRPPHREPAPTATGAPA
ncbi:ABC transporter permease [Promicromonospora sp. NPDC019610]|uniref:YhgE/Pip domain-containing protein n=1 Tax=Promicromonospora sp. NPDC019610 TaxID=3364405 RepID=UPI00379DC1BA